MTFIGRLRRVSAIYRQWRESGRVGGVVGGVQFRFICAGIYETDELLPADVTRLQAIPDVEIMTIGTELPKKIAAVHALAEVIKDETVKPDVRARAAVKMLDTGYGKPKSGKPNLKVW